MNGNLTMILVGRFLLRQLEKKMDGDDNYELAQADQLVMAAGTYSHPRNPEKALQHSLIKDEDRERVRQEQKQGRTRGER